MTIAAVVGMQWGDEGKGKIVDSLSDQVEIVVRCQGGANAGHTVVLGEEVYKLHIIPSGILRDGVMSVVGNGVVFDPLGLVEEIDRLEEQGVTVQGRLLLSDRAHLVMPYHRVLDTLSESQLAENKIGTTGRGIGPTYAAKASREGVRGHNLLDADRFMAMAREKIATANRRITWLQGEALPADETLEKLAVARERLAPFVADTVAYLHQAQAEGRKILIEGAQGSQLDIDFGTYPFVTSSNTTGGGFASGTGLPPNAISDVHGVFKAFTTRVGAGPFVTELLGDEALQMRGTGENQWDEFGTTTGRPRRCGWADVVIGRYSKRLSGINHLHITKLDVLTGFEKINICVAYELDGKKIESVPADIEALERCQPVYETMPGWQEPITEATKFEDLPAAAQAYVKRIFSEIGIKLGTVSVGPRRKQIVTVKL
ncbi:MAG: adenylosuccinate synthase [Planctomycetes bacterium]|nr:adenylosuccinate synthase [Planctomycetota bacterium]